MNGFDIMLRQNRIHGFSAGSGDPLLLCFHGFGETCNSFDCLSPLEGETFTLVAVDLPGHGETVWKEPRFTPDDLGDLIGLILERFGKKQAHLLGNSLGARFALCAEEKVPGLVGSLVLLAPDGLRDHFWYRLATATAWSNRFFQFLMKYPSFLFRIIRLGRGIGFFNASVERFFKLNMETPEKRQKVYEIWTSMMGMNPDVERVKAIMKARGTSLLLVYGQFDRVSPVKLGESIFQGQPGFRMVILPKGHHLLSEETSGEIKRAMGFLVEKNGLAS